MWALTTWVVFRKKPLFPCVFLDNWCCVKTYFFKRFLFLFRFLNIDRILYNDPITEITWLNFLLFSFRFLKFAILNSIQISVHLWSITLTARNAVILFHAWANRLLMILTMTLCANNIFRLFRCLNYSRLIEIVFRSLHRFRQWLSFRFWSSSLHIGRICTHLLLLR